MMSSSEIRPASADSSAPRALVIGAGPAACDMHLPALARLRDRGAIVLAAICDIQHERAAEARRRFGFLEDCSDGLAALARDDIDVAYLFGSAQLHYEYGMAALRSRKHLFVEKPIAPSFAQACELAQTAREHSLVAVGGHNRRFYRSLALVRARAGKSGWRLAEAVFHKPEMGKPVPFGARTWLTANGIHALDALLFMMGGLPQQLTAFAERAGTAPPSAFSAVMRWADGRQAVFTCNNDAGLRREEYVFHALGETCTVTESQVLVQAHGKVESIAVASLGEGIEGEHESFLQAVRQESRPPHALEELAPALFLAELIEDGFSGPVHWPEESARRAGRPGRPLAGSILVTHVAELQTALARLLPQYRLISLEEVRRLAHPRNDVVAAILGRGSPGLPADVIDRLPGLQVVGVMGLSVARYGPEALLQRGITLVNASSAYADSVAEFALGLAILGRRRAFVSHELMRKGGWGTQPKVRGLRGTLQRGARRLRPAIKAAGLEPYARRIWRAAKPLAALPKSVAPRDLRGGTVGLIGWGANARAFARRLSDAGASVMVYSERGSASEIRACGAVPVSLDRALGADIVSLHRGLTQETWHCIGASELARLRPGSVLINVARGALVDPAALLARLKQGDVFACLDTYEVEPPAVSDALRRLPNVFLTSHIAGGSADMHAAAAEEVVSKVAGFLAGETVDAIGAERLNVMT